MSENKDRTLHQLVQFIGLGFRVGCNYNKQFSIINLKLTAPRHYLC